MPEEKCVCQRCGKAMDSTQFYTYKDGTKTELCKKCLTAHIDNFDPSTFLWLLEKMDVPYVPEEWNILRDKAFAKDPYKMNGMSVFGKYLSKMKLKQWKDKTWADSEECQKEAEARKARDEKETKAYDEEIEEKFKNGEISSAQYKTLASTESQHAAFIQQQAAISSIDPNGDNYFKEEEFISEKDLPDPSAELTEDDKLYLAMKWGRLYKPNEWIELEQKYTEMMEGFDIQDPDTKSALILICKTYLKMNQAIDIGDVDGFNKLSRTYDTLRKSTKFTAAQNKKEKEDFVDCVGMIVSYCEKEGGQIPQLKIDAPRDLVDKEMDDMKEYTKSLIYQDTALAQEIENYLKNRMALEQQKVDKKIAKEQGLDAPEVTDDDYQDFLEHLQKDKDEEESL